MISVNSVFVGPIMVIRIVFIGFQVMEIQVEEISPSIGVVKTKIFYSSVAIKKFLRIFS